MPRRRKITKEHNQLPQLPWREYFPEAPELAGLGFPPLAGEARELELQKLRTHGFMRTVIVWQKTGAVICADSVALLDLAEHEGILKIYGRSGSAYADMNFSIVVEGEDCSPEYPVNFALVRNEQDDIHAAVAEHNLNKSILRMSRAERRNIWRNYIVANYRKSNRWIASEISIDHKTVGTLFDEAVALGKIPQNATRLGRDERELPPPDEDETIEEIAEQAVEPKAAEEAPERDATADAGEEVADAGEEDPPAPWWRDETAARRMIEGAAAEKVGEDADRPPVEPSPPDLLPSSSSPPPVEGEVLPPDTSNGVGRPTLTEVVRAWDPAALVQQAALIDDEKWIEILPIGTRLAIADRLHAGGKEANGKSAMLKAAARAFLLRAMDRRLSGNPVQDAVALTELNTDIRALQREFRMAGVSASALKIEFL
jgi:hypothetical protein